MAQGQTVPGDAPIERTEEERKQRRTRLTLLLIPIVAFSIAGTVINLAAPALINTHPLVVIFFNPINRYLLAASNHVSLVTFLSVAFFRLVLTDPLYFLLGRWYGDGALNWMEEKTGGSGMIPLLKKWFARAGGLIVFLAPNGYVCLLAGASGMPVPVFISLNVTGTILRLILIRKTANLVKPVLDPVLRFVKHYQWLLVAFSIATFAIQYFVNKKRGKSNPELQTVKSLEAEIEASIDKTHAAAEVAPVATKPVAEQAVPAEKLPTKKAVAKRARAKRAVKKSGSDYS